MGLSVLCSKYKNGNGCGGFWAQIATFSGVKSTTVEYGALSSSKGGIDRWHENKDDVLLVIVFAVGPRKNMSDR